MSRCRIAPGYTFKADVTMTASYDGGAPVNVAFSALEHFDTIDDLLSEWEDRVATAIGAGFSSYVDLSVNIGRVVAAVGALHTISIVWGVGAENVRLRNYLGWAADLAPAAMVFQAPVVHLGAWYPLHDGALVDRLISTSGLYHGGRANTTSSVGIGPQLTRPSSLTFNVSMVTHAAWTEMTDFRSAFAHVLDGETFGVWPEYDVATHDVYRLAPETDTLSFAMDMPPNDSRWTASFAVWKEAI